MQNKATELIDIRKSVRNMMSNGQPKEEVSDMPFAKVEQFDHLEE